MYAFQLDIYLEVELMGDRVYVVGRRQQILRWPPWLLSHGDTLIIMLYGKRDFEDGTQVTNQLTTNEAKIKIRLKECDVDTNSFYCATYKIQGWWLFFFFQYFEKIPLCCILASVEKLHYFHFYSFKGNLSFFPGCLLQHFLFRFGFH